MGVWWKTRSTNDHVPATRLHFGDFEGIETEIGTREARDICVGDTMRWLRTARKELFTLTEIAQTKPGAGKSGFLDASMTTLISTPT